MMKILTMTWSVYDERLQGLDGHCTGGGLLIKQIANYIGKYEESYLFIGQHRFGSMKIDNINIVKTDYVFDDIDYSASNQGRLEHMERAFCMALDDIQPDVVNIHGIGDLACRCARVCQSRGITLVATNHLQTGKVLSPEIGYSKAQAMADEFYNIVRTNIIAVSSGVKNKLLEDYSYMVNEDITVILNGTDYKVEYKNNLNLPMQKDNDCKLLLCVGTLIPRKNPLQIVRAYLLLPEYIKKHIKIVFCGKDCMDGQLQEMINDDHVDKNIIYAGMLDHSKMNEYYSMADGLIMTSLSEGLSLTMLEMMAYGKPVVTFSDLEGVSDIYTPEAVCCANDRTDEALAKAIIEWYKKEWNDDVICQHAKYFNLDRMARDYIEYYKRIIIRTCKKS